jgi:hypothetical protein
LAVVIGCGGGGGGGNGGGNGGNGGNNGGVNAGNNGGGGVPTVNLPAGTDVQIYYLSGAGRRAVGSQTAQLNNIRVQNGGIDQLPTSQTGTNVRIQLDGYTNNSFNFSTTLAPGLVFKTYTEFPFRVDKIDEEQPGGGLTTVFNGPPFEVTPPLALDMTLYAGRQVTLQVNINDQMLRFDGSSVVFDQAQFVAENYDPIDNRMNSFLSDQISFDLTNMAAGKRPSMLNGQTADRVFFSGDQIAVSKGFHTDGTFNVLNPVLIEDGRIEQPSNVGVPLPGSYSVIEPDPRDITGLMQITALQGKWKEYTEVLNNLQSGATVNMIVMPNSRRTNEMQVVAFNRNANGQITDMWQGVAKFNGVGSTIDLFSLDQLDEGTGNNPASGTLAGFVVQNGVVTQGTYTIAAPPAGFPLALTGNFVVLRRVN